MICFGIRNVILFSLSQCMFLCVFVCGFPLCNGELKVNSLRAALAADLSFFQDEHLEDCIFSLELFRGEIELGNNCGFMPSYDSTTGLE